MHRTFILHASGAKLPSDLLGFTCVRYGEANPSEMKVVNQKLRKAIENEGRVARIEGLWWHFSLTARGPGEPSAVSLMRISRGRDGALKLRGPAPGITVLSPPALHGARTGGAGAVGRLSLP